MGPHFQPTCGDHLVEVTSDAFPCSAGAALVQDRGDSLNTFFVFGRRKLTLARIGRPFTNTSPSDRREWQSNGCPPHVTGRRPARPTQEGRFALHVSTVAVRG